MNKKSLLLTFSIVALSGCVYSSHTTKLDQPIPKPRYVNEDQTDFYSVMSINGSEQTSSIGDDLFVISRYLETVKTFEKITHLAPTSARFPQNANWSAKYSYNDGKSGDLLVYTSPKYYQSNIGVILDSELVVATQKPLVQVKGVKEGRRWTLKGHTPFFKIKSTSTKNYSEQSWGLRFGGVSDGMYIFEIVNRMESTVSEVLQTVRVTEQDFLSGFVIRDVFVHGTQAYKSGLIKFKAVDRQA